ncbi:hypothetical protein T492DRAFT_177021 [Pavlovales sp. CCMP2436]|nr:hypothetical protein T492DRAFT_177021 [Pavlovales sp. CCMP2436]
MCKLHQAVKQIVRGARADGEVNVADKMAARVNVADKMAARVCAVCGVVSCRGMELAAAERAAQGIQGEAVPPLLKACARCKIAWCCSTACQRKDWPSHKKECQPPFE